MWKENGNSTVNQARGETLREMSKTRVTQLLNEERANSPELLLPPAMFTYPGKVKRD